MPLIDQATLPSVPYGVRFFIFYANRDENGEMWCPDCRKVEAFVKDIFEKTDRIGLVFYVGNKTNWKRKQNRYRRLFNVQRIPTILQMTNTIETFRLEEDDILHPDHLQAIVDKSCPFEPSPPSEGGPSLELYDSEYEFKPKATASPRYFKEEED